jgi:hypothetical protein
MPHIYRCRACRRGLMTPDRMARALWGCSQCGSRLWVPAWHLTLRDRWRLPWDTGLPPWTTAEPDPEW